MKLRSRVIRFNEAQSKDWEIVKQTLMAVGLTAELQ